MVSVAGLQNFVGFHAKFPEFYFIVFHDYPLATLIANPGRREGHDLCFRG